MTDYKFEGWCGLSPEAGQGKMVWQEFEPKPWEETDVDIKVTHCGICGSDLHTLRSGWVSRAPVAGLKSRLTVYRTGTHQLPLLRWTRGSRHCRPGRFSGCRYQNWRSCRRGCSKRSMPEQERGLRGLCQFSGAVL